MNKGIIIVLSTVLLCLYAKAKNAKNATSGKVLISMLESQAEFFDNEIIKPYSKAEKKKITVEKFGNVDSIPYALSKNRGEVCVVKVPFDKASSLVDKGFIRPLEDFLTADEITDINETYLLTSLGRVNGKQYYMPRKFETRIMVYRRSKVSDVVRIWNEDSSGIGKVVRKFNGHGLPDGYVLEENPDLWDFYDVFVAGLLWAKTPYDGKKSGRIGHRSKKYSGTALRVIDRAFSLGADSAAIVNMSGDGAVDSYYWEAVYAASGCYTPRMKTDLWSGAGIWQGFKDGDVFLSFMTQLDCFMIHGTGRDGIEGYLKDADDLGFAAMPKGCSFEVGPEGAAMRQGSRAISTGGWWWGIPSDSPDPRLSYSIIKTITSTTNQVQESNRFGMVPVRKDILSDMSMLFGGGWITDMYNVSFRQIMANKKTVLPSHPKFDQIRDVWLDAWFDIVLGKNWSADGKVPDRKHIEKIIRTKYQPVIAGLR